MAKKSLLRVPVKFGRPSAGAEDASVKIQIDRSRITLGQADEILCGHRIDAILELSDRDEDENQKTFIEDVDDDIARMECSIDAKSLSVSRKRIGVTLAIPANDSDLALFMKFRDCSGRLTVKSSVLIPEKKADKPSANGAGEEDAKKHVPGSLKFEGDPQKVLMSQLFKGGILKALDDAGIHDVKEFGEFTSAGKKLSEIDGIGPGKAAFIADTLVNFYSDNPPEGGFELRSKKK